MAEDVPEKCLFRKVLYRAHLVLFFISPTFFSCTKNLNIQRFIVTESPTRMILLLGGVRPDTNPVG